MGDDGEDRYDRMAWRIPYWQLDDLDDRPEWEVEEGVQRWHCSSCRRWDVPVDDYDQCDDCRVAHGWCRWCVDERIAYRAESCCRTCYRWLQRNRDSLPPELLYARLRDVADRRRARRRGR